MSIPGVQKYSIPGVQEYSIPGVQEYSIPGVQKYSILGVQEYSIPGVQEYSIPGVQEYSIPGGQEYSIPGVSTRVQYTWSKYRSTVYLEYRSEYGGKRIPGLLLTQQIQNSLRNRNRDSILVLLIFQEHGPHPSINIISGTGTPS